MYDNAINELQVKLEAWRCGEVAYRKDGNIERAEACAENIASIEAAIARLQD